LYARTSVALCKGELYAIFNAFVNVKLANLKNRAKGAETKVSLIVLFAKISKIRVLSASALLPSSLINFNCSDAAFASNVCA
jgi:hypothetical protein